MTNLEKFKAFLESDISAVRDSHQEIELMLTEGDMVAVRAIYSGGLGRRSPDAGTSPVDGTFGAWLRCD